MKKLTLKDNMEILTNLIKIRSQITRYYLYYHLASNQIYESQVPNFHIFEVINTPKFGVIHINVDHLVFLGEL